MAKYVFNVYDRYTGEKITQLIDNTDNMLDTLKTLNEIGMVKSYIIDDKKDIKEIVKNDN